ncbi:MAG: STAS domain-containing protein [Proteobacteria bacterium]|nr:STAS domain-containing protein [Pseudomonadota bacterium]
MKLNVEAQQGKVVAKIGGSMDTVSAPKFQEELETWIAKGDRAFVVDVSELEYITSAGLRSILAIAKKIKADQGTISFCGLDGMVKEVFEMSFFTQMFPIHTSLDEALGS